MVSRDARLTFRALLNVVDDFGRFDGRIPLLRSLLYPVDRDVTDEMVAGWLHELTLERPTPPLAFYSVDGVEYLHFPGWEEHCGKQRRRKASIYPNPPPINRAEFPPLKRQENAPDPLEKTAGLGLGLGLGDGGGEGVTPATPSPPANDSLEGETPTPKHNRITTRSPALSQSDSTPQGEVIESSKTVVTAVELPTGPAVNTSVNTRDATRVSEQHPEGTRRPKAKRGTRCPETLTSEQWTRVHSWRDANYPHATNTLLDKIWRRHANFHRHRGKPGFDWVLSFYNWAAKDLDELPTTSTSTARADPPAFEPEPPPPPHTEAELAEIAEISAARHKKWRAHQPETATDTTNAGDDPA